MLAIPKLSGADAAFGNIEHMPKYDTLPEEFKERRGTPFNEAVSSWFFKGGKRLDNGGLEIDGQKFMPKPGVDADAALRAIKAVLGSFAPKHEHKEAACAFMLSEWFDLVEK